MYPLCNYSLFWDMFSRVCFFFFARLFTQYLLCAPILALYILLFMSVSRFKALLHVFSYSSDGRINLCFTTYFEKFSRFQFVLGNSLHEKTFMKVLLIFNTSRLEIMTQEKWNDLFLLMFWFVLLFEVGFIIRSMVRTGNVCYPLFSKIKLKRQPIIVTCEITITILFNCLYFYNLCKNNKTEKMMKGLFIFSSALCPPKINISLNNTSSDIQSSVLIILRFLWCLCKDLHCCQ